MPSLRKVPHERFATLVAMGWSQAHAYRDATRSGDFHASWREGCRWRKRKDISARIDELRRDSEQKAAWTKTRLVAYLESVLEAPPAGLDADSPIVEEFYQTKHGPRMKPFSKAAAAVLLVKLHGWEVPERREVSLSGSLEIDAALRKLL